jgi:cell division protease FtsH
VSRTQNVSESTAQKIDAEVKRLVDEGHALARKILTKKNKDLVTLASGLLEFETLSGEEINNLLKGIRPKRDDGSDGGKPEKAHSAVPRAGGAKRGRGAGDMEPQPQA